jgi:hypothetical protein
MIVTTTIPIVAASVALDRFAWPPFAVQFPAYLALLILYVIYVLRASVNVQNFQNERVGTASREQVF